MIAYKLKGRNTNRSSQLIEPSETRRARTWFSLVSIWKPYIGFWGRHVTTFSCSTQNSGYSHALIEFTCK